MRNARDEDAGKVCESTCVFRCNMRQFEWGEVACLAAALETHQQTLSTVELTSNSLTRMPVELLRLAPTLRTLTISWNMLSSIPASIGRLRRLETLDLSFNRLEILPPQLCCLYNLKSLCLSDNDLLQLPDAMGDLSSLERLKLQYNQLTCLPQSLSHLTKLSSLSLAGNPWQPPGLANAIDGGLEQILRFIKSCAAGDIPNRNASNRRRDASPAVHCKREP